MIWFVAHNRKQYPKYKSGDSIRPKGRPKKKEEDKLPNITLHITEELKQTIEYHKKDGERASDTLLRIYREQNFRIIDLKRQLDKCK